MEIIIALVSLVLTIFVLVALGKLFTINAGIARLVELASMTDQQKMNDLSERAMARAERAGEVQPKHLWIVVVIALIIIVGLLILANDVR